MQEVRQERPRGVLPRRMPVGCHRYGGYSGSREGSRPDGLLVPAFPHILLQDSTRAKRAYSLVCLPPFPPQVRTTASKDGRTEGRVLGHQNRLATTGGGRVEQSQSWTATSAGRL